MSANEVEILRKVRQWLNFADEDLRLARHALTLSTGVPYTRRNPSSQIQIGIKQFGRYI